jgi:hypothetical protein
MTLQQFKVILDIFMFVIFIKSPLFKIVNKEDDNKIGKERIDFILE